MRKAAAYYETRQKDLGRRFLASVQDAVYRITLNPHQCPTVELDVRRCLTRPSPSVSCSGKLPDVIVMAVTHLHRDPDYWKTDSLLARIRYQRPRASPGNAEPQLGVFYSVRLPHVPPAAECGESITALVAGAGSAPAFFFLPRQPLAISPPAGKVTSQRGRETKEMKMVKRTIFLLGIFCLLAGCMTFQPSCLEPGLYKLQLYFAPDTNEDELKKGIWRNARTN